MRVVSLLPSATEIVHLVAAHCQGQEKLELVGRSHECDYPPGLQHLPMLTASRVKWCGRWLQLCCHL
jgi:iron complex transport system substrate-binding protein